MLTDVNVLWDRRMMMTKDIKIWYARTSDHGNQTFEEHASGASEIAAACGRPIGMDRLAGLTAHVHDIGKCRDAFQDRLFCHGKRVDHATYGAKWLWDKKAAEASICVSGHHRGLRNVCPGDPKMDDHSCMSLVMKETACIPSDEMIHAAEDGNPYLDALSEHLQVPSELCSFAIRGLFSCLVEGDWSDSARFESGVEYMDMALHPVPELLYEMNRKRAGVKNRMRQIRNEILEACIYAGRTFPQGFYSLTVPTGSGKTCSSMAFAQEHAKANGFRRIFYIIPYRSIIDQTVSVFRSIFGEDQVMAVHSSVEFDSDSDAARRNASRWNAPIIVTTAVAFFEAMYSNRPSGCIKLHSLFRSIVVFDEVQSIPLARMKPCMLAVRALLDVYQCSVLFCTATQPVFGFVFKDDCSPKEIVTKSYWNELRRVTYRFLKETVDMDTLCRMFLTDVSSLCILNTRRQAQKMYLLLKDADGIFHLSTWMHAAHRERVISEVSRRLRDGETCRLVSTSVVEAGVDFDFGSVFRELLGLVNIVQAAGRCNREGKRSREESIVTVFCLADEKYSGKEAVTCRHLLERYGSGIDMPDVISQYFMDVYSLSGEKACDRDGICAMDRKLMFEQVFREFYMIDDLSYNVYILSDPFLFYKDRKKADRYLVPVSKQNFEDMLKFGIVKLFPNLEDERIGYLADLSYYRDDCGLDLVRMESEFSQTGCGLFF